MEPLAKTPKTSESTNEQATIEYPEYKEWWTDDGQFRHTCLSDWCDEVADNSQLCHSCKRYGPPSPVGKT